MAEDGKTYQPGWGEKKTHHHHHNTGPNERNRGLGGALRMKDKQAYFGFVLLVVVALAFGAYKVFMMFVNEFRQMPNDDPTTEMNVDELRIHKVAEQDALKMGDSIAQAYQFDSTSIHRVQIETRPVYRPPRQENAWYITEREWKSIWKNYHLWRKQQNSDQEKSER